MLLTGDGHVHSEWSHDTGGPRSAAAGRMEAMCRRALKIGLPALAFTEHLDLTGWVIDPEDLLDHLRPLVGDNDLLIPEPLDVAGYLESVERCRGQFPGLRILSGVEFGQPHIDADKARQLVDLSALDRVNGSLHTLPISEESGALRSEPITLYRQWPAERVIWEYLAEARRMITDSDMYEVLSHIASVDGSGRRMRPVRMVQRQHRDQPSRRHQIRIVEYRRRGRKTVAELHFQILPDLQESGCRKPKFSKRQGIAITATQEPTGARQGDPGH